MPDDNPEQTVDVGGFLPEGEVVSEGPDPFAAYAPLPGVEHHGRAIVDRAGMPSGSPANYENLRGAWHPGGHRAQRELALSQRVQEQVAAIVAGFAPPADSQ